MSRQPREKILANRYEILKKLGKGSNGVVYLVDDLTARKNEDNLKVAKSVHVGALDADDTVHAVHEAKLLRNLDHPYVLKCFDSFLDVDSFYIITDYCNDGDLNDAIQGYKKQGMLMPENLVIKWFLQMLSAVKYIHGHRVLHRDLKTRNVFLCNRNVKLGDFGISRLIMGTMDYASTFVGTPYYMSPEVLKHVGYKYESDLWSVGVILYEMCAQQHAFDGQGLMGVMYKIVEGPTPRIDSDVYHPDIQKAINLLLVKDPNDRASLDEIEEIPLFHKRLQNFDLDTESTLDSAQVKHLGNILQRKEHVSDIQSYNAPKSASKSRHSNYEETIVDPIERARRKKQEAADRRKAELNAAIQENNARKSDMAMAREKTLMTSFNNPLNTSTHKYNASSSSSSSFRNTASYTIQGAVNYDDYHRGYDRDFDELSVHKKHVKEDDYSDDFDDDDDIFYEEDDDNDYACPRPQSVRKHSPVPTPSKPVAKVPASSRAARFHNQSRVSTGKEKVKLMANAQRAEARNRKNKTIGSTTEYKGDIYGLTAKNMKLDNLEKNLVYRLGDSQYKRLLKDARHLADQGKQNEIMRLHDDSTAMFDLEQFIFLSG